MKDLSKIKNPTTRKVKNRGFTPIAYHSDNGVGQFHDEEVEVQVQFALRGEVG